MKGIVFIIMLLFLTNCDDYGKRREFIELIISKPEILNSLVLDSNASTESFRKIYSDTSYKIQIYYLKLHIRNYFKSGYKILENYEYISMNPTKLTNPFDIPEYKETLKAKIKIQGIEDKVIIFYFNRINKKWLFNGFLFDEPKVDEIED